MDDVQGLPKDAPPDHSASNGALQRYQEKLISKYLFVIQDFQRSAQIISEKCNQDMTIRMEEFQRFSDKIKEKQNSILSSLGTTPETFDELRERLSKLGEELIKACENLREDVLAIYGASFNKIKPFVDKAFEECEQYINQLPEQYSERLSNDVKRLNANYLKTKLELTKTLYTIEMDTRSYVESTENQFVQRADEWKSNRFATIVEEAKKQLDPNNPLDFGTIYDDFFTDQGKFTHCARKLLSSVTLVAPPDHFTQEDLDNWWKEVEDILQLHGNFIQQFTSKFEAKFNERNEFNQNYLNAIEKELVELKNETEASLAIADLAPLYRASQKMNSTFIGKLQKYWQHRSDSLRKSYESIRDFLSPLINLYHEFCTKVKESDEKIDIEVKDITESSDSKVNELETELAQKSSEINLLATEKDIHARVLECKTILSNMETEYKEKFNKIIEIYNQQPTFICTTFETCENEVLNQLKLKKTANSIEFENSSRLLLSSHSTVKKKQPVRTAKRPVKGKDSNKQTNNFQFTLDSGAKFEETEPLVIIPTFDDFVDENAGATNTPNKGRQRGKAPPPRAKRAKATPRGRGRGGKNDESEDIECPEINLAEVVPKKDGVISIWVYIPMSEETVEWCNSFRQQLLTSIHSIFTDEMRHGMFTEERQTLSDELNERMRVHAPRPNAIELNVAQTRVLQIESRQIQLEKHFRNATTHFNKGLANVEAGVEKRKKKLLESVEKIHSFVDDLEVQKATTSFSGLVQNMHIKVKQFTTYFEKETQNQENDITNFVNSFKALNERFMNTVVLADDSFSKEEREMSNQFFERMNAQIETIINNLNEKAKGMTTEVEKRKKEIMDEFDATIPHHKADVVFIEQLNAAHIDAKTKLDSLMSRNKQQEIEIDRKLGLSPHSPDDDQQKKLKYLFQLLDDIRVAIINRGLFLSLLKSKMIPEPITINIDLAGEVSSEGRKDAHSSRDGDSKSKRSNSRSKSRSKGNDKNNAAKGKTVAEPPKEVNVNTLKGQLENLTQTVLANINKLANDYYNNLKTRKFNITRPNQIPATLNECIEQMTQAWNKQTSGISDIIAESALKYRCQVTDATSKAREYEILLYNIYISFYKDLTLKDRATIQEQFDNDLRGFTKKRQTHKDKLNLKLADKNKESEFKTLLKEEEERTKKETELIAQFNRNVIECERKAMNSFTHHLPTITKLTLNIFDKFVLMDDLISGKAKNIERKTMRELMKEKERRLQNPNDSSERPFHSRDWSTLPYNMEPMSSYQPIVAEDPPSERSTKSKSKSKKAKNSEKLVAASSVQSQVNNTELMPVLSSLETPLHRGAIVERNRCYNEYESYLSKRIDEFGTYVKSLLDETEAFTSHWRSCIIALKPNYVIP